MPFSGRNGGSPRFIRTLHGFGYAFCGTVEGEPPPAPAARSTGTGLL